MKVLIMYINSSETLVSKSTISVHDTSNINATDDIESNIDFIQMPFNSLDVSKMLPATVFEKQKAVDAIVTAANALEVEHKSYEEQYLVGGRKVLYALLAKVYALAIQIDTSDYRDAILKELRNRLSLEKKIKTQKNSNAITMIVRWVVGSNRQTAHNFSKALQAAFNDNISAGGICNYFTERGGLQSVKTAGQSKTIEKKAAIKSEFVRFLNNADSNYAGYENTKIHWSGEVFGDQSSTKMMILGESWGGGQLQGYRAFTLSNDAYVKICSILSDEVFKDQSIDAVTKFVDDEFRVHAEIAKNKHV